MNLYIHVPFCRSKCRYCAFHSEPNADLTSLIAYPARLLRELTLRGHANLRPTTIYIGGGTPSLLGPDGVQTLLRMLPQPMPDAEVTMEVNPADVTPALAVAMRTNGVTRVSIGAQSFDPATLRWLGRRHTANQTRTAIATLRAAGFTNLSLDLIAAIPGETPAIFHRTLAHALALDPTHLSVYPLTLEEGTPLHHEAQTGNYLPIEDDAVLEAIAEAESTLRHAGLHRYEISNYARPSYECRHNLAIWRGEDYIGLGPSAASREGLTRRVNIPDTTVWCAALDADTLPPATVETLPPDENERERFITRLRLAEGQRPDPATAIGRRRLAVFRQLETHGLLEHLTTGAYALTRRGREVADAVMAECDISDE